jgi:hypothetical protein
VHFVVSERRRIGERLANVLLFQVWQLLDNLCRRHPVGDQVDNVRDRDAKAANSGSASEDIRVAEHGQDVRDAKG